MSLSSEPRRKTGYHHNDLRNALQDEALRLISERNGPAFSLRELGEAIGVSHTAVYRHFASKSDLLRSLTARGFDVLHRYQQAEIARAGHDPLRRLYALGDAYTRFARENSGAFWLMFGERGEEADRAKSQPNINREALKELIDAIVLCQRENIVIAGDPYRIANYLIMAPHGYACYSAKDLELVGVPGGAMSARTIGEIALIPVLVSPPSPQEIAERYLTASPAGAASVGTT